MNYEFELNEENIKNSLLNDTLKRNTKINNLLKLINSLKKNTIINIDGDWGTGKTVFVKQIEALNKYDFSDNTGIGIRNIDKLVKETFNSNHIIYYYNAWENDLHTNPLQSLLLFLLNELPKNENAIVDFDKFKEILPKHILKILNGVGSTFITGLNNKAKDITGIDIKETVNSTIDLVNDINELKDYKGLAESIITINEIKEAINDLLDNLLKENKKIVFIIDELDRCRPDFAVQLLETITHFYDNDKIIFLVSSNNEQLSHTVSKFYGINFDGYGYLNKIYNFTISLEKINPTTYVSSALGRPLTDNYFDSMALAVFEYYNFSMREIGRYLYYMEILSDYYYHDDMRYNNLIIKCVFLPYCLGLKIKDIKEYNNFSNGFGIDHFILFMSNAIKCKEVAEDIFNLDKSITEENKKSISLKEYVKEIYAKYFSTNNNDYNYKYVKIKEIFFEVLSMISNYSTIN